MLDACTHAACAVGLQVGQAVMAMLVSHINTDNLAHIVSKDVGVSRLATLLSSTGTVGCIVPEPLLQGGCWGVGVQARGGGGRGLILLVFAFALILFISILLDAQIMPRLLSLQSCK
jgi:hypothetical protein